MVMQPDKIAEGRNQGDMQGRAWGETRFPFLVLYIVKYSRLSHIKP